MVMAANERSSRPVTRASGKEVEERGVEMATASLSSLYRTTERIIFAQYPEPRTALAAGLQWWCSAD
jgi:hypothetical protein